MTTATPVIARAGSKYGTAGGCSEGSLQALGVPEATRSAIAGYVNLGLAKNTWSTYQTAERWLVKCLALHGSRLALPISVADTVTFVHYLVAVRGLKSATISGYLAGVRQLHIVRGMEPPQALSSELVKQMLKGIANRDGIAKRGKQGGGGRLPITPPVMLLLKKLAREAAWEPQEKLLFWAVATLAFAGAFRVHELLAKAASGFDPQFALLTEDVTLSGESRQGSAALHVRLKCPKETRVANPTVVDVLQSKGHLCPVRAFSKWALARRPQQGMPLFSHADGKLFTGRELNARLQELLGPYADVGAGAFSSHSFRIGLATTLGGMGCSDQEVKAAGRWSSRAFELYMRLPRGRRSDVSRRISQLE